RLVVLGVKNGDRVSPRRNAAEHASRLPILDRRDRAAHFLARLAEAVGGGIKPATHRAVVVAHAGDRYAQSSLRLRVCRGRGGKNKREGEEKGPAHSIAPNLGVPHFALSKARPKPSSGRLMSTGFLFASCTVIFKSCPLRMAATNFSGSVRATKHPTLVQVWIGCRSGVPLSTLTDTGSVRLRRRGSVMIMAPLLPSGAGRTATDTNNWRVSRWKICCTARQSSVLPSPAHSTRHAAGGLSGAGSAGVS